MQLPNHNNITAEERKALFNLKKDSSRVITKADKGNCFVVLDKASYEEKMEDLLSDSNTYEKVNKPPFKRLERELNERLLRLKKQEKLDKSTYQWLHSSDGLPPAIRGSVKHHKPDNPLRPIITSINTAFYNTSRFLTAILSPLQNQNGFIVGNSADFAAKISNIDIKEDETMVSFDVVSLFTAIPVKKACNYIHQKEIRTRHNST